MVLASLLSLNTMADENAARPATDVYFSPQDVFNAYRLAQSRTDWRTVFCCYTPEMKERRLLEVWQGSNFISHKPEVQAVLKKYGAEPGAIESKYFTCIVPSTGLTSLAWPMKRGLARRKSSQ